MTTDGLGVGEGVGVGDGVAVGDGVGVGLGVGVVVGDGVGEGVGVGDGEGVGVGVGVGEGAALTLSVAVPSMPPARACIVKVPDASASAVVAEPSEFESEAFFESLGNQWKSTRGTSTSVPP
jgi:hypothetical protein